MSATQPVMELHFSEREITAWGGGIVLMKRMLDSIRLQRPLRNAGSGLNLAPIEVTSPFNLLSNYLSASGAVSTALRILKSLALMPPS